VLGGALLGLFEGAFVAVVELLGLAFDVVELLGLALPVELPVAAAGAEVVVPPPLALPIFLAPFFSVTTFFFSATTFFFSAFSADFAAVS